MKVKRPNSPGKKILISAVGLIVLPPPLKKFALAAIVTNVARLVKQ